MKRLLFLIVVELASVMTCAVLAQDTAPSGGQAAHSAQSASAIPTNTSAPESTRAGAGAVKAKKFLSDFEFWLSFEILLFGFGVILVEYKLLRNAKLSAEEALRVYAVTLIIVGTLFAITAGFDSNQIAPAMGLFGTIAGYLLGKRVAEGGKTEGPQEDNK